MNQIQKHFATRLLHKSDNNTGSTTKCNNHLFLHSFYQMTISFCLLLHPEDKALLIQILSKYHLCAQKLCILWGRKATRKALQNMYLSIKTPTTGILENPNLKRDVFVEEKKFFFLLISIVSLNHLLLIHSLNSAVRCQAIAGHSEFWDNFPKPACMLGGCYSMEKMWGFGPSNLVTK